MPRINNPKPPKRAPKIDNRRVKKKPCSFCVEKTPHVSYLEVNKLKKYVSERGKIVPRRISGTCALHQRMVTVAIKRARVIAFLPFVAE